MGFGTASGQLRHVSLKVFNSLAGHASTRALSLNIAARMPDIGRRKLLNWMRQLNSMCGRMFLFLSEWLSVSYFFISKLWYVLQVVHWWRVNIQLINRIFAVFHWASQWERTSRTNHFLLPRAGGVGLCCLFIPQIVSRFTFIRNEPDPFLWTAIQTKLFDVLPGFVVSACRVHYEPLSDFLSEVVCACRFLFIRFSLNICHQYREKGECRISWMFWCIH